MLIFSISLTNKILIKHLTFNTNSILIKKGSEKILNIVIHLNDVLDTISDNSGMAKHA